MRRQEPPLALTAAPTDPLAGTAAQPQEMTARAIHSDGGPAQRACFLPTLILLSRSTMLSARSNVIQQRRRLLSLQQARRDSTAYSEVLVDTDSLRVDLDSDNPQPALWRLSKT